MYYEFYLDLYFTENLIMNYLVLELAQKVQGHPVNVKRKVLAAAAGAFGACMAVLTPLHKFFLLQMFWNLALYLPVTALAFGRGKQRCLKQNAAAVFMVSLVLGSIWHFLTAVCGLPFFAAVPAGYVCSWLVWKHWRTWKNNTQFLYDVRLERKGKTVLLKGFLDSGNHLWTPVTGKPVHILEYSAAQDILSEEEKSELLSVMKLEYPEKSKGNFFMIPYRTIGNDGGLLPVMEIDRICIKQGESVWSTKGVLAAVTETLSGNREAYQMILHPKILISRRKV